MSGGSEGGRGAVVTGGASGLGAATVRRLARAGYEVAVLDLDEVEGEKIVKEVKRGVFVQCDVSDEDAVKRAIDIVKEKIGDIHVVVNSAGIAYASAFIKNNKLISTEILKKVLDVNLVGTFNVCKLAAQAMISQKEIDPIFRRGVIINVSSQAGIEGQVGQTVYSISKGAVNAMTLPMARDLGRYGIRVNTIAPGMIPTPMSEAMGEDQKKVYEQHTPFGRLGTAEEFAECVLAIVDSTYVNGAVIRMDGGNRAQRL